MLRAVGWNPPPYFASQPANASGFLGTNVSLSASAAGDSTIPSPTITYQWQAGPAGGPYTNLVEGAKYAGTATDDPHHQQSDRQRWRCGLCVDRHGTAAAPRRAEKQPVSSQAAPVLPAPGSYGA